MGNREWGDTSYLPDLGLFHTYQVFKMPSYITIPNGDKSKILHYGTVKLQNDIFIHNVLHVPDFAYNLLSVRRFVTDLNLYMLFTPFQCLVQGPLMSKPRVLGSMTKGLYYTSDVVEETNDYMVV